MDFMSLPDEMIASVTKYSNNQNIRRVNKRTNRVVKKYKLDGILCKRITLTQNCLTRSKKIKAEIDPKRGIGSRKEYKKYKGRLEFSQLDGDTVHSIIDQIMNKVRGVDTFILTYFDIDEILLEKLSQHANILRKAALKFRGCNIMVSAQKLKNFANKVELSHLKIHFCESFRDEESLSDELLAEFLPTTKLTFIGMSTPNITSLSLHRRVTNNQLSLSLGACETQITLEDLVQFLKSNELIKGDIILGFLKGTYSIDRVTSFLREEFPENQHRSRLEMFGSIKFCLYPKPNYGRVIFRIRQN